MLTISPAVRIYLGTGTTDLRRSIDGLSALVRERFTLDPLSGHLFLFRHRRGDRLKVLGWDRWGIWIFYKRLERGTFAWPTEPAGDPVEMRSADLLLLLSGVELTQTRRRRWLPIGEQLHREIVAADYLQTDDTPVTFLDAQLGSRKGRIWTYLDPLGRQVVFDATETHERDGPAAFLTDFRGDLQADAYTGYDALYATGRIREVGCWAHTRRGFVEALATDVRAALMVALIQQLYQMERAAADLSADARRTLRQEQSIPLLAKIQTERDALAQTVLPKSPLAIDNNRAENQLRGVAVGRKHWLFAGSVEGARRAALLYSLVQSCALIGVPPFDYLKDVLLRVATHPHHRIAELTPNGWAATGRRDVAA